MRANAYELIAPSPSLENGPDLLHTTQLHRPLLSFSGRKRAPQRPAAPTRLGSFLTLARFSVRRFALGLIVLVAASLLLFALLSARFNFAVPETQFDALEAPNSTLPISNLPTPALPSPTPALANLVRIVNNGSIWFSKDLYDDALLPYRHLQQTRAVREFSPECLDGFVASGVLCEELRNRWSSSEGKGERIDVLWSWVNGTDEVMGGWRKYVSDMIGKKGVRKRERKMKRLGQHKVLLGDDVSRHFR